MSPCTGTSKFAVRCWTCCLSPAVKLPGHRGVSGWFAELFARVQQIARKLAQAHGSHWTGYQKVSKYGTSKHQSSRVLHYPDHSDSMHYVTIMVVFFSQNQSTPLVARLAIAHIYRRKLPEANGPNQSMSRSMEDLSILREDLQIVALWVVLLGDCGLI